MDNIRLHETDKTVKMYSRLEVRTRKETIAEKVRIASNSVCTGRTEKKESQEGSSFVNSRLRFVRTRASPCTSTKSWRYISPEKETSTDTKQIKAVDISLDKIMVKRSRASPFIGAKSLEGSKVTGVKQEAFEWSAVNREAGDKNSKRTNEVKVNQDTYQSTRTERIRASPYIVGEKPKEKYKNTSKSTGSDYVVKTFRGAGKAIGMGISAVKLANTTIQTVSEIGNSDSAEKVRVRTNEKIIPKLRLNTRNIRFVQKAVGTVGKPIKFSGTTSRSIHDSTKADLPEESVGQLTGKGISQTAKAGVKLAKNTIKLSKNVVKYAKLYRVKKKALPANSLFSVPIDKNPSREIVEKGFTKQAELKKTERNKLTQPLKNESTVSRDTGRAIGPKTAQRHGVKINEWANKEKKGMLVENKSRARNAPSNPRQSLMPKRTARKGLNNWAGKQTARLSSWANIHAAKAGSWVSIKTSSAVTQLSAKAATKGASSTAKLGAKVAARAVKTTGAVANAALKVGKTVVQAVASAVNVAVSAAMAIIGAFSPVVILIISIGIVGMLVTSALGIFWSDQTDTGIKIRDVVVEAEAEFQKQAEERVEIAKNGGYDKVEVVYDEDDGTSFMINNWTEVASVFAVLQNMGSNPTDVVTITPEKAAELKAVFFAMNNLTIDVTTELVSIPIVDMNGRPNYRYEKHATITLSSNSLSAEEGAELYAFNEAQYEMLEILCSKEFYSMWCELLGVDLYGGTTPEEMEGITNNLPEGTKGAAIVKAALTRVGDIYSQQKRYQKGYADCSSLTWWAYKQVGVTIPGSAGSQAQYCLDNGYTIAKSDLQPGDLVFWENSACEKKECNRFMEIHHVAIYVGNGKLVEASTSEGYVVVRGIWDNRKWKLVMYARPHVG